MRNCTCAVLAKQRKRLVLRNAEAHVCDRHLRSHNEQAAVATNKRSSTTCWLGSDKGRHTPSRGSSGTSYGGAGRVRCTLAGRGPDLSKVRHEHARHGWGDSEQRDLKPTSAVLAACVRVWVASTSVFSRPTSSSSDAVAPCHAHVFRHGASIPTRALPRSPSSPTMSSSSRLRRPDCDREGAVRVLAVRRRGIHQRKQNSGCFRTPNLHTSTSGNVCFVTSARANSYRYVKSGTYCCGSTASRYSAKACGAANAGG